MSTFLRDGIGASLGDSLAMEVGYIGISNAYYVSSVSGANSADRGRSRERPFASIEYALGFCVDHDVIVALSNHVENSTGQVEITVGVVIVGEGSSGGLPTSVWGCDASLGSDEVIAVTGDDAEIRNIKFTANQQTHSQPRIGWAGANGRMKGCLLQADQHDAGPVLFISGDNLTLDSCKFIPTSTTVATAPLQAIRTETTGITMLRMRDCIVSGGVSGWSSENASVQISCNNSAVRIEGQSLLLGADILLDGTFEGFVSVPTATGGAQVRGV